MNEEITTRIESFKTIQKTITNNVWNKHGKKKLSQLHNLKLFSVTLMLYLMPRSINKDFFNNFGK